MAYTKTDLESIDRAILDYGLGKRAGRVVIGPHTVEFADASEDGLLKIRAHIAGNIGGIPLRTTARNMGRT